MGHLITPIMLYYATPSSTLEIFYLHTKFGYSRLESDIKISITVYLFHCLSVYNATLTSRLR